MKKQPTISSRDLGLEFAAICGKHFLGIEHLHYGYWPEGLAVEINNLRAAQEKYTDFLVSHIPAGVRTILDVGCGSGHTSKLLTEMGYNVACVSPSPVLSQQVRQLLGPAAKVFECQYQQVETSEKFDLVLFSESFQYIKIEKALEKTFKLLNPSGWLLICDVFRKDLKGASAVGGGHRLAKFQANIANFPFELVEDIDITQHTAPNLYLLDEMLRNVVRPIVDSGINFINGRHPLMSKVVQWLYRKRINFVYSKYFDGRRTSDDFRNFKSYRLFLYRNACAAYAQSESHTGPILASNQNISAVPKNIL